MKKQLILSFLISVVCATGLSSTPPPTDTEAFLSYLEKKQDRLEPVDTAAFSQFVKLNTPEANSGNIDNIIALGRFWKSLNTQALRSSLLSVSDEESEKIIFSKWCKPAWANAVALYEKACKSGYDKAYMALMRLEADGAVDPRSGADRVYLDEHTPNPDGVISIIKKMGADVPAEAYFIVGDAYSGTVNYMYYDDGNKAIFSNAAKYYAMSGDKGLDKGYVEAADIYLNNLDNFVKGNTFIRKIKDRGEAEYILAKYYERKPLKKALWIKHLKLAAEYGQVWAMSKQADFLSTGDLNRRDYAKAADYYMKAAEKFDDDYFKAQSYLKAARIFDNHKSGISYGDKNMDWPEMNKNAIDCYEKAMSLYSYYKDECLLGIGNTYGWEEVGKSVSYLERVSPDSPQLYCESLVSLYRISNHVGDKNRMNIALTRLKNYKGNDYFKYIYLGALYRGTNNVTAAECFLNAAKAASSDNEIAEALVNWDELAYCPERQNESINFARKIISKYESPKTCSHLASRISDRKQKAELYKKALKLYAEQGDDSYDNNGLGGLAWNPYDAVEFLYSYYEKVPSKAKMYWNYAERLGIEWDE